jgi:hypothetical protein
MYTPCSYEADFMQGSLNKKYGDFVDRIYHIELEIKDTTDTARSASYLGLMLDINSDKEQDFNFPKILSTWEPKVAKIKHTRNENGQNVTHQNKTTLFWRKKIC